MRNIYAHIATAFVTVFNKEERISNAVEIQLAQTHRVSGAR